VKQFQPFIMGSGMAGDAIKKSLQLLNILEPQWRILPAKHVKRDESLRDLSSISENPLLFIAHPAGLHAKALREADEASFRAIFCEKPVAVSLDEIDFLKNVKTKTAVFHVYRQSWGPQKLKEMVARGEFGEVFSVESRYWQPSGAHRALHPELRSEGWKTDPLLAGPYGVLLDLGTHWIDLVSYILGDEVRASHGWLSYANTDAPHRDTHIHCSLDYSQGTRALGSISKVVHGSANDLDIHIHGSKKSASWKFLEPDQIIVGVGRDRSILTRQDSSLGSKQSPYHGLGWLEGYIEICRQVLRDIEGEDHTSYPTLAEALRVTEVLLTMERK
jgi:predicted dehydrogenase